MVTNRGSTLDREDLDITAAGDNGVVIESECLRRVGSRSRSVRGLRMAANTIGHRDHPRTISRRPRREEPVSAHRARAGVGHRANRRLDTDSTIFTLLPTRERGPSDTAAAPPCGVQLTLRSGCDSQGPNHVLRPRLVELLTERGCRGW